MKTYIAHRVFPFTFLELEEESFNGTTYYDVTFTQDFGYFKKGDKFEKIEEFGFSYLMADTLDAEGCVVGRIRQHYEIKAKAGEFNITEYKDF